MRTSVRATAGLVLLVGAVAPRAWGGKGSWCAGRIISTRGRFELDAGHRFPDVQRANDVWERKTW